MPVTLRDVARESGFSVTTVSRALAGYDDVNEETRAKIIRVANQIGYQPNLIARQLKSQRTYTIGMVLPAKFPSLEHDFFSVLMSGVRDSAAQHGYDLLISSHFSDDDEMEAYHRIVGGNRVDGMIIARIRQEDTRLTYLRESDHPFVVSGRSAPNQESNFPYIDVDSQSGIRMIVEHFLDYGHQHIGFIASPPELAFTPYRLAGYREGLENGGILFRPDYVTYGDLTYSSGQNAALQLLNEHPEITAIIASNDLMALGAMQAIREQGLVAGEHIAVGGFDDIPATQHASPALTTIRQPIYQIGEQLTDLLVKQINGETLDNAGTLLMPELVIRESSGEPVKIQ